MPTPRSFEEQIYTAVVNPNDSCYDIGGNIGEVSLLLSQLAGRAGRVVVFEPVWPLYAILCDRLRLAGEATAAIIAVPLGLAEKEMTATIQVPGGNFGMGSLAPAAEWAKAQPGTTIGSYQCRFTTLDAFLDWSRLPPPDFIKIDVEGAELFVLRGANRFFASGQRPLLLLELFAPWERAFQYGPWEVLSLLAAWGYRFLFACPHGLVEHQPSAERPYPPAYTQGYNVLAFHPANHASRLQQVEPLRLGGGATILPMPPPPVANTLE